MHNSLLHLRIALRQERTGHGTHVEPSIVLAIIGGWTL